MGGNLLVKDMTGRQFGFLTVIGRSGYIRKEAAWLCRCKCGTEKRLTGYYLRCGAVVSCGCKRLRGPEPRHGKTNDRIYGVWSSMKARCSNPKNTAYHNYGGRGIKVCERWLRFDDFYADMGDPPAPGMTIDRINNDGNYEPANCRWATWKQQANNSRTNIRAKTSHGILNAAQIGEIAGIGYKAVLLRWQSGLRGDDLIAKNKRPRRSTT